MTASGDWLGWVVEDPDSVSNVIEEARDIKINIDLIVSSYYIKIEAFCENTTFNLK